MHVCLCVPICVSWDIGIACVCVCVCVCVSGHEVGRYEHGGDKA